MIRYNETQRSHFPCFSMCASAVCVLSWNHPEQIRKVSSYIQRLIEKEKMFGISVLMKSTSPTSTTSCKEKFKPHLLHLLCGHVVRLSLHPHSFVKQQESFQWFLSLSLCSFTHTDHLEQKGFTHRYCLLCPGAHAHSSPVTFCTAGCCDCLQGSDPDNRLSILCLSPNVCQWAHRGLGKVRAN